MKHLLITFLILGSQLVAADGQRFDLSKRASEIDRLSHTIDVIEKLDPKAGAELQRELLFDPDLR